ncbi:hypothetical protein SESBI_29506, partial [Sesbania bispinosa]
VSSTTYPDELKEIVGRELLFKIKNSSNRDFVYDESYKVKKLRDDAEIIEAFKADGSIVTPHKLKFILKFSVLSSPKVKSKVPNDAEEDFPILTPPAFSSFEMGDSSSFGLNKNTCF